VRSTLSPEQRSFMVKSAGIDTIALRNSSDTALALQVILAISADAVADGPIN
jgi:hypothetical protein